MSLMSRNGAVAIDPPGCGCTECITGEYVPLDQAQGQHILDLFAGRLRDSTGEDTDFQVIVSVDGGEHTWTFRAADLIDAIRGGAR